MVRIIGVDIPDNKRLEISLTYIYGIGRYMAARLIEQAGLDGSMKAKALSEGDIAKINTLLQSEEFMVEGDLRRKVQSDIKRLISIHSYRGFRHKKGLPVRGQRTRTNARTRKGKKRTVAGKKG